MKLTVKQRDRIKSGDIQYLLECLLKELDETKNLLMAYRPEGSFDNVLKGRGLFLSELIKVLED